VSRFCLGQKFLSHVKFESFVIVGTRAEVEISPPLHWFRVLSTLHPPPWLIITKDIYSINRFFRTKPHLSHNASLVWSIFISNVFFSIIFFMKLSFLMCPALSIEAEYMIKFVHWKNIKFSKMLNFPKYHKLQNKKVE